MKVVISFGTAKLIKMANSLMEFIGLGLKEVAGNLLDRDRTLLEDDFMLAKSIKISLENDVKPEFCKIMRFTTVYNAFKSSIEKRMEIIKNE